jgi:hypothetical protein
MICPIDAAEGALAEPVALAAHSSAGESRNFLAVLRFGLSGWALID